MDLIEQLGGYNYAKESTCAWFYKYGLNWQKIKQQELLEYRRQQNIFEVGDKILSDDFKSVFTVKNAYERYIISISPRGVIRAFSIKRVRHATPEEIEAGKRS